MYLGIRTDSPEAQFYLYKGTNCVTKKTWQADRNLASDLLSEIEIFLNENNQQLKTLNGLFVYLGPGSFTGLRIGITVMNTLAYGLSLPIVGENNDLWSAKASARLLRGDNDISVQPFYGSNPRITKPKK